LAATFRKNGNMKNNIIIAICLLFLSSCASKGASSVNDLAEEILYEEIIYGMSKVECESMGGRSVAAKGCEIPTKTGKTTPDTPINGQDVAAQPGDDKTAKSTDGPTSPTIPDRKSETDDSGASPPSSSFPATYSQGGFYTFPKVDGPMYKGSVSFTLEGLNGSAFPINSDGFLFMLMGKTPSGTDANLQFHITNSGGHDAQVRLISQRFGDNSCHKTNQSHCESADGIMGMNLTPSKIYSVVVSWDERNATMTMATEGEPTLIWSGQGEVKTWGAYNSVEWIRVGNAVFPGKSGQSTSLTVLSATDQNE